MQQQIVTLGSNLKVLHPAATKVQVIPVTSRFSAFAGNSKQSQQPPPTHVANSCQEVLLHVHQRMQTKVNRDFGSSNTPQQHHFEDRWSLKTNKIPATHSCSATSGLWPRKHSSCSIFSWTRATFISWRQGSSLRLWQWTHVRRHLSLSHSRVRETNVRINVLLTFYGKTEIFFNTPQISKSFSPPLYQEASPNPFYSSECPMACSYLCPREENVYYTVFSRDFTSGIIAIWPGPIPAKKLSYAWTCDCSQPKVPENLSSVEN